MSKSITMNSIIMNYKVVLSFISVFFIIIGSTICQSIEYDKKIGAESAEIVKTQIGLYDDEDLTNYLNTVGQRLVAEIEDNPFDFHFYIADSPIPNAFALPGGYIYFTRGILTIINTEDELACILAHEIIHVTERHSVKRMRQGILPSLLQLPGNIVGMVVGEEVGALVNNPIAASSQLMLASYSRKQETQADKKGIELAAKAGYDPIALGVILERLVKTVELLTDSKEQKSYFDSHPYTPKRVDKIEKESVKLDIVETDNVSADFPAPLDGMLVGYNPAKGVFNGDEFIHPDLNFTLSFPRDWKQFNQATAVGAVHAENKAAIVIGLEDPSMSPEEHARNFEKELLDKYNKTPEASEHRMVNGNNGYLISMEDNSGKEVMYIHLLWLKMDDKVFQLIGVAPRALETRLKETASSLRTLSDGERKGVKMRVLQVTEAKTDENIEELSNRSAGVVDIKLLALINGVEDKTSLDSGKAVKIITEKKYIPKKK